MEAFIVRPFGVKQDIDFEQVHNNLVVPALKKASIATGIPVNAGTTGVILEQGNIREDMFSLLLTADLVIADISIHNANVFYELGIRHALQDKRTFLIRSSKDEVPFDLKTDRYLSYDAADPASSVDELAAALKATLLSEKQDSPVFYMLPRLQSQDRESFLAVPAAFGEEVELALAAAQSGKLALLAKEAENFPWQIPALRVVGNAQFQLKLFNAALVNWEKIRDNYPQDPEANDRLATIYQRLADRNESKDPADSDELLKKSDQAINRLLANYVKLDKNKRAETYSLRARNTKSRWLESWEQAPGEEKRKVALRSKFLLESFEDYERGYIEDLNHFYSGLNALGLLVCLVTLATELPDTWAERFENEEEAGRELTRYKDKKAQFQTIVRLSVESEKNRLQREGKKDPWLAITEADLACITSLKPLRVANLYRDAIMGATGLNLDSSKRQLLIYEAMHILPENVKAALAEFEKVPERIVHDSMHYLLFTGHMIDQQDRQSPRFPPGKEIAVRAAIRAAVELEVGKQQASMIAIAGGACGGDIIFHEVCKELGIRSELYLAMPREKFIPESVDFAGPAWIERFNKLDQSLIVKTLLPTKDLPKWLQKLPGYNIWMRTNLWMMNRALECGGRQMTLIALWDKQGGDAAGGTEHMVSTAKQEGAKTEIIDIREL